MNPLDITPPGETFNFAAHLLGLNRGRGAKAAYIDDNARLSYAELDDGVRRMAAALLAAGVRREERVLLLMHDSIDWPLSFLGALYAGIVPVAANTMLTADDYAYMLRHSRAQAALVSAALLPALQAALAQGGHEVKTLIVARAQENLPAGALALHAMLARSEPLAEPAATHADEPAFWLYSSGSTGRPKGTVHTHANPYWTAELYGRRLLGVREDDICFSAAKLFFAYGLGNALSFPLSVGATVLLMAERATPDATFKRWLEHRPTLFFGAPTGYAGLLASPNLPPRSALALRLASSAGEALPAEIGERFQQRCGVEIIDGIGSTEMLHIFLSNAPGRVRWGSTGWPVPGYEIELRAEDGTPVADGETGELYVRGPSAALLYWNRRDKTRETFQGGWTKSGDKYVRNADASYTYAGRSDDMLKVSGQYVSPFEVEATLMRHAAVLEAAVVGVSDAQGLTKSKAFVVLKHGASADADELKAFVKERLAPHKYPRRIEFVAELPKTATGKIQRFKLREREAAGTASTAGGRQRRRPHRMTPEFITLDWGGRAVRIEYAWVAAERHGAPLMVFLHEGLGSLAMWKDFPQQLCTATGCRGLVYSRPGYGQSTPRAADEHWQPDFMHRQAHEVLPALLRALGVHEPLLLFGHSDGASIALLHAALAQPPGAPPIAAAIVLAPHILVEALSITSIEAAREAYLHGDLRTRLARYHADVDSAFWGWNRIWLASEFRRWSIEAEITAITCPLLAVQGADDEYGTLEQIKGITRRLPQAQALVLPNCGHSPQRDQPAALVAAVSAFLRRL